MTTAQEPLPGPQFDVVCHADIEVRFWKNDDGTGQFAFAAIASAGVEVKPDGEIRITASLQANQAARLSFTLAEDSEASGFTGVRIGVTEADAKTKPEVTDTGDADYEGTFFRISSDRLDDRVATLTLTEVRPAAPPVYPFFYFYVLSVVDSEGAVHSHDPRIYNKGEGAGTDRV